MESAALPKQVSSILSRLGRGSVSQDPTADLIHVKTDIAKVYLGGDSDASPGRTRNDTGTAAVAVASAKQQPSVRHSKRQRTDVALVSDQNTGVVSQHKIVLIELGGIISKGLGPR